MNSTDSPRGNSLTTTGNILMGRVERRRGLKLHILNDKAVSQMKPRGEGEGEMAQMIFFSSVLLKYKDTTRRQDFCHPKMEIFLKTSSHADQSDQSDCLLSSGPVKSDKSD